MSQKPKWIYLCMHLHTYVSPIACYLAPRARRALEASQHVIGLIHMYTRNVIGRSWVRVPQGVSYFPRNFVLGFYLWHTHIHTHTHTHIYIYIYVYTLAFWGLYWMSANVDMHIRKPMQIIHVCICIYIYIYIFIYKQTHAYMHM